MTMRTVVLGVCVQIFVSVSLPAFMQAQDSTTPEELRTYATRHSIGVEWDISGDANHNASASLRYRAEGSADWQMAYAPFRIDFAGANMFAGSVLFLRPGVSYELELQLEDADGGSEMRNAVVRTELMPQAPTEGRELHVAPGSGGGSGTESDPYQGISAADNAAMPGDVIRVHAGDYGGETRYFGTSGREDAYVAWVAAGDGPATFGPIRVRGDYVWIEGLELSADDNVVRNEGDSNSVAIVGNQITGCFYCIHLNSGASGWYIADNTIVGNADPASGSFSGEGIELQHTPNHTVAHNSISRVADGISYPDRNVDIFGNDIFETSDDGIEADDGYANVRIWNNRIHHAHNNGVAFQPMNSAPWYIVRNQVIGSNESVLKLRSAIDRVLLAHNTFVGWGAVFRNSVGFMRNMTVRNNIWVTMTGDYFWEDTGSPDVATNWRTSIDYDGFAWPDDTSLPLFKWFNERYTDLNALRSAHPDIESNAVRVPMSCFESLDVSGPAPAVIPPQRVTLADGCVAVDAGEVMANINDGYIGTAPDLGAHERGASPIAYGPRALGVAPPSPPTGVMVR